MSAGRRNHLLVHALYLALSLLFATRFFTLTHPGSHAMTGGDPALMCWTLQWVSRALVHDPWHLYAGNTFFPYPHAVILTDPMVSLAILNVPVRWLTSNPWVGYNLLIVAAYYLSCVGGAALTREVTGSTVAAVWGGVFWGFLFFRVHHIGHLQILSYQWMPFAMVALLRFWRRPGVGAALLFVLAFVAQALVSWYLAVILVVVLAVVAICRPLSEVATRPLVKYYALILAVAAAAILPFALPYRAGFTDSTLGERNALVDAFGDAVHLADYLTPPQATLAGRFIADNHYWIWGENTLYIGFVPLALAAIAVIAAVRRRPSVDRRSVVCGLALVATGYVLALGFVSPSLGVALPLHYGARLFPIIAGMRATQRFSLVLYVGVLLLSGAGFAHLVGSWPRRRQIAICAAVCAGFLVEVFPVNLPFSAASTYALSAPDRFIAQVQRTRPAPLVVLHLPIYYLLEAYPTEEATYMVDSTAHWANILNGFSGGVPNGFMERMTTLNSLPAMPAVRLLLDLGVEAIAVHHQASRREDIIDFFTGLEWASIVRLSNEEFVVLIDQARARRALGAPS